MDRHAAALRIVCVSEILALVWQCRRPDWPAVDRWLLFDAAGEQSASRHRCVSNIALIDDCIPRW